MINAGVSAETLKVVMRHREFSTTERYYVATKKAQSAAGELVQELEAEGRKSELVGASEETPKLSPEEVLKLKSLLNSL